MQPPPARAERRVAPLQVGMYLDVRPALDAPENFFHRVHMAYRETFGPTPDGNWPPPRAK